MRKIWERNNPHYEAKLANLRELDAKFKEYRVKTIRKEIVKAEERLKNNSMWSKEPKSISEYKELKKHHAELLKVEKTMWRQRIRVIWLKEGDKNTKFFNGKANQRRKVNALKKLKDENGVWRHGQENIERILLTFFSDLFSSSDPSGMDQACLAIQKRLGEKHKVWCEKPFSRREVREATDQMQPLKDPGPDGLPALFY